MLSKGAANQIDTSTHVSWIDDYMVFVKIEIEVFQLQIRFSLLIEVPVWTRVYICPQLR